jgi:hypothetical protein
MLVRKLLPLSAGLPENTTRFLAHWRSLPRQDLLPSLRGLHDYPLHDLAPMMVVVDVISEFELRFREVGRGITMLYGKDLTGSNALSLFPAELRPRIGRDSLRLVTHPCGITVRRSLAMGNGALLPSVGMSLPLQPGADGRGRFVNYTHVDMPSGPRGTMTHVCQVVPTDWIDIGAGVPM